MDIAPSHRWVSVDSDSSDRYRFPDPLGSRIRKTWAGPAVYRWLVYRQQPGDVKRVYIGETEQLPRRIDGYRNPGPTQQTNKRIRAEFESQMLSGLHIALDVLTFEPFTVFGTPITMTDLADKHVRVLLESIFVIHYSRNGYVVLNA